MTFYIILIVLFLSVFGFLAWRIVMNQATSTPPSDDMFVCPVCNEKHCECHKKNDDSP